MRRFLLLAVVVGLISFALPATAQSAEWHNYFSGQFYVQSWGTLDYAITPYWALRRDNRAYRPPPYRFYLVYYFQNGAIPLFGKTDWTNNPVWNLPYGGGIYTKALCVWESYFVDPPVAFNVACQSKY
jgi:hypothetical protein